ncbi:MULTISPECIES: hypothetical protein [unclassified Paenibacillus]|uniref:hypothetical protein n=1 Tax=unclassified Paenibacillus TaxID=185978 RepID=UPI001115A1AE|nr:MULTISPECIES: hypothetical protein [unclassified Paenibacillus]QID16085.1 hypothetical protein CIC07_25505 [Paenibacillus sp. RUD330]
MEHKLAPVVRSGKRIEAIRLMVSEEADIASRTDIGTAFGTLQIEASSAIPKGYAYLLEKPLTPGGISFAWVTKRKPP